MRQPLAASLLLTGMGLAACSIDITQTPSQPTAEAISPTAPTLPPSPDIATLGLSGRLIAAAGADGILQLDLATGELSTLFQPPPDGVVNAAAVSPGGDEMALAYAPPPDEDELQFGYTSLYVLSGDTPDAAGDAPRLLLEHQDVQFYFRPAWSPDGSYLYYGFFNPFGVEDEGSGTFIERIPYPDGARESLLEDAYWPVFSPDGSQMAYINIDTANAIDELYVANADGTQPRRVVGRNHFTAVDAPLFTPDGESLLFSAFREEIATSGLPGWVQRFVGVGIAKAHQVPSDFWLVPVSGGDPTQLTDIREIGLVADYSPDEQHIAFISTRGFFLMDADGSNVRWLLDLPGLTSLDWMP